MASRNVQYQLGDQTKQMRYALWESSFQACPKCKQNDIQETRHVISVRRNGDSHGVSEFVCSHCKWRTSFLWDDAGHCYYYETFYWNITEGLLSSHQK